MAFQTPITIKEALENIHRHEYVLPAIQREFVWKQAQICRLFDSMMREYPIGSFLLWRVERETVGDFKFYDFVRGYHQKDAYHCPELNVPPDTSVIAVLDGQQRLTALNIGLRGSHTIKEPRKWWGNPDAFPEKKLHLNLLAKAVDNEEGLVYDFRFLTENRATERDDQQFWFPVPKIYEMNESPDVYEYLHDNNLSSNREAYRTLDHLRNIVHVSGTIAYFLETSQDIEKVLNIFIRTNSGGTVLSYSDLLLSIATAQWDNLNARQEIFSLVDDLNSTRNGFSFSKDFVLKAGLMLSDISSVGFKVTNFNRANMQKLEENWPRISNALRYTIRLAADFGFSEQNLGADSSLLPIAYYLYHREVSGSYLTSSKERDDRDVIRNWLIRSLLKSGVWGSGLDTLLTQIRAEIQEAEVGAFPVEAIETVMIRRGRSVRFEDDEIEDLVDSSYGNRRTFALLALLFPFVDLRNEFHVDHIFPQSRFTKRRLIDDGVPEEEVEAYRSMLNRMANLQLLEGAFNISKSDKAPLDWVKQHFTDKAERENYMTNHMFSDLPGDIRHFPAFFQARRARLSDRLKALLQV